MLIPYTLQTRIYNTDSNSTTYKWYYFPGDIDETGNPVQISFIGNEAELKSHLLSIYGPQ